ncbi:22928_t:CDS:2, partial [Gigaspora margarita]
EPRTINKKKLELQDQLHQAQSKNARLELRLIEEQNKETSSFPPYYSAGIYPDACIECGYLNVNKPAKDEYPRCSDCG